MWILPAAGKPYALDFVLAEIANQLPSGLLSRVAWQESRFNPEAQSGAGAQGIMQIVPRWHPDVNPWDPQAAIAYAGQYLRQLHNQFGSWALALAAYNYGPGNVNKVDRNIDRMPKETRLYVLEISRDVSLV